MNIQVHIYVYVFRAQADWTLTHKDTEQSTTEACFYTLDGVTLTDSLIR
jgi:hypothetical protein